MVKKKGCIGMSMESIIYLIVCAGVGLIWRQWRLNNIKGDYKGRHVIPKGHDIFIFNPNGMYINKIAVNSLKKEDGYKESDFQFYEKTRSFKYDNKTEVAIIALNHDNAVKKARNLLNKCGYGPEHKTVRIKSL